MIENSGLIENNLRSGWKFYGTHEDSPNRKITVFFQNESNPDEFREFSIGSYALRFRHGDFSDVIIDRMISIGVHWSCAVNERMRSPAPPVGIGLELGA